MSDIDCNQYLLEKKMNKSWYKFKKMVLQNCDFHSKYIEQLECKLENVLHADLLKKCHEDDFSAFNLEHRILTYLKQLLYVFLTFVRPVLTWLLHNNNFYYRCLRFPVTQDVVTSMNW